MSRIASHPEASTDPEREPHPNETKLPDQPLHNEISTLDESLSALGTQVNSLLKRLQPVLGHAAFPAKDDTDTEKRPVGSCDVGERILILSDRALDLTRSLDNTIDCLKV